MINDAFLWNIGIALLCALVAWVWSDQWGLVLAVSSLGGIHADRAWDCLFPNGVASLRIWPPRISFHGQLKSSGRRGGHAQGEDGRRREQRLSHPPRSSCFGLITRSDPALGGFLTNGFNLKQTAGGAGRNAISPACAEAGSGRYRALPRQDRGGADGVGRIANLECRADVGRGGWVLDHAALRTK